MIDVLGQSARYSHLHPAFARAFAFLRETDFSSLPPGRHDIEEDAIYVSIDHVEGRGREGARLESHRRHIDIQLTVRGVEQIGWKPLVSCQALDDEFVESRDVGFYRDQPDTWLALPPGTFAIFFPEDAHAPLAGNGPVRKAIVKVRL